MSQEEGRPEVFVQEVGLSGPEPGTRLKVSRSGGREPKWSVDGTELFYRGLAGSSLLGVDVDPETLTPGPERVVLNDVAFPTSDPYGEERFYAVSSDGRFVVLLEDVGPERAALVVMENWLGELESLVPAP